MLSYRSDLAPKYSFSKELVFQEMVLKIISSRILSENNILKC
jgi:hypothetical protein